MAKTSEGMPGFMTYREAALIYTLIPFEEAGKAISAVSRYFLDGEETHLEGSAKKVYEIMTAGIDRDRASYQKKREGGMKGNANRWGKGAALSHTDRIPIAEVSHTDPNINISHNNNYSFNNSSSLCCDSAGAEANEVRKKRIYPHDSMAYKAAAWLSEDIRTKTPQVKPHSEATIQAWADSFRLLNERDGYDWNVINDVLAWARNDEFWSKNILSGRKFREQFEALLVKSGVST